MKSNLILVAANETPLQKASREYHGLHAVWMNTSVFTEEGKRIKAELAVKREAYLSEYRKVNPTHIAF